MEMGNLVEYVKGSKTVIARVVQVVGNTLLIAYSEYGKHVSTVEQVKENQITFVSEK